MSESHFDVPEIVVCICTRNRALDLALALDSVRDSSTAAVQTIVSDDSTDTSTRSLVQERFPEVLFIEGPRTGLCANRNTALRSARGTHVLFIDDDARLGRDFIRLAVSALNDVPEAERGTTIVSGVERQNGTLVYPSDQDFLGFQQRRYRDGDVRHTVVINATLFPLALFERIGFDTNLIYGCDEVDLTTRAVALGYTIRLCPNAVNDHYPSPVNRDFYAPRVNASRLYVTFKRYLFTDRAYAKAALFVVAGPVHLVATLVRRRGLAPGLRLALASIAEAISSIVTYLRRRPDGPALTNRAHQHARLPT